MLVRPKKKLNNFNTLNEIKPRLLFKLSINTLDSIFDGCNNFISSCIEDIISTKHESTLGSLVFKYGVLDSDNKVIVGSEAVIHFKQYLNQALKCDRTNKFFTRTTKTKICEFISSNKVVTNSRVPKKQVNLASSYNYIEQDYSTIHIDTLTLDNITKENKHRLHVADILHSEKDLLNWDCLFNYGKFIVKLTYAEQYSSREWNSYRPSNKRSFGRAVKLTVDKGNTIKTVSGSRVGAALPSDLNYGNKQDTSCLPTLLSSRLSKVEVIDLGTNPNISSAIARQSTKYQEFISSKVVINNSVQQASSKAKLIPEKWNLALGNNNQEYKVSVSKTESEVSENNLLITNKNLPNNSTKVKLYESRIVDLDKLIDSDNTEYKVDKSKLGFKGKQKVKSKINWGSRPAQITSTLWKSRIFGKGLDSYYLEYISKSDLVMYVSRDTSYPVLKVLASEESNVSVHLFIKLDSDKSYQIYTQALSFIGAEISKPEKLNYYEELKKNNEIRLGLRSETKTNVLYPEVKERVANVSISVEDYNKELSQDLKARKLALKQKQSREANAKYKSGKNTIKLGTYKSFTQILPKPKLYVFTYEDSRKLSCSDTKITGTYTWEKSGEVIKSLKSQYDIVYR